MARPKSTPERPLPAALSDPCERFLKAMERDNGLAANTLDAYRRDLNRYLHHLSAQGVEHLETVQHQHIAHLLHSLRDAGLTASTMARNLTSIKRFHQYLLLKGTTTHNPAELLDPPKLERRLPDVLSVEEIAALLAALDPDEPLGQRDQSHPRRALRHRHPRLRANRAATGGSCYWRGASSASAAGASASCPSQPKTLARSDTTCARAAPTSPVPTRATTSFSTPKAARSRG